MTDLTHEVGDVAPAEASLWVQQHGAHLALQPLTHPQPLLLLLPPHYQVRHYLVQNLSCAHQRLYSSFLISLTSSPSPHYNPQGTMWYSVQIKPTSTGATPDMTEGRSGSRLVTCMPGMTRTAAIYI